MIKLENASVHDIAKRLLAGEVALIPTDTVYGLAAVPHLPFAVSRIFKLKGRSSNQNLPVMVSDVSRVTELGVCLNESARRAFASPFVPGALTIAVGFSGAARPGWLNGRDEVAIRIPACEFLRGILRATGPLLVTSANYHGSKTPERVWEILKQLHGVPDIVVDGGTLSATPSTLLNCRKSPAVVEREGSIPVERLGKVMS
jgi:L-threonylcarbamoyladenylate synthase